MRKAAGVLYRHRGESHAARQTDGKRRESSLRPLHSLAMAMALGVLAFASCTNEAELDVPANDPAPVPDGKVRLALHTNAGEYQTPVTRAGFSKDDEDQGSGYTSFSETALPIVLVFELPDWAVEDYNDATTAADKADVLRWSAELIEAAQAYPGASSVPVVTLGTTERPVRLLIVANPPKKYYDYSYGVKAEFEFKHSVINASSSLMEKSFDYVARDLQLCMLEATGGVVGSVPYAGGHIPMTGFIDLEKIDSEMTSIGESTSKIYLKRVAAKITVKNEADDFVFEGATVLNANRSGLFYRDYNPNSDRYTDLPTGNYVNYLYGSGDDRVIGIAKSSTYADGTPGTGDTSHDPIYIYESDKDKQVQVIVLLQGKYKDTRYWYRIALKSSLDGKLLAVERNKHYEVLINDINMVGHATLEAALAASGADNVNVGVRVSDLSGHETISSSKYYLSVSNSCVAYYAEDTDTEVLLTTVSTNAPAGTPISITRTLGDGITLNWTAPTLTNNGEEVTFDIRGTFTTSTATGKYSLKVGELELVLNFYQNNSNIIKDPLGTTINGFLGGIASAEVIEGKDWLSLSFDNGEFTDKGISNTIAGSTIDLKTEQNIFKFGGKPRFGEIMSSVQTGEIGCRVRTIVRQEALNSIAPFFARSNIVMYKDGSNIFLTFAETSDDNTTGKSVKINDVTDVTTPAIPANAQGILFRWGGMVGLSCNAYAGQRYIYFDWTGNNAAPAVGSHTVFVPEEYVKDGGWTQWIYTEAPDAIGQIPYLYDEKAFNINKIKNLDAFVEVYGEKGYDETTGRGDICRYISDKGWVKEKWRMPNAYEYSLLIEESVNQAGKGYGSLRSEYTAISNKTGQYGFEQVPNAIMLGSGVKSSDPAGYLTNPGNAHVIFPASGYRVSNTGAMNDVGFRSDHWSSTSNYNAASAATLDYAHSLNILPDIDGKRSIGTYAFEFGHPVRCIKD